MPKISTYFIVNPFSGVSNNKNFYNQVTENLDLDKFNFDIKFTEYAGHATKLAEEATKFYDLIVAVGGDGTVNEVAQALRGTDKILGVLPAGSGNGYATHIGYGRKISQALQKMNSGKSIRIDTCTLNEHLFINMAGAGFDAKVAYLTRKNKLRGLIGYLRTTFATAFSHQMQNFEIEVDGNSFSQICLTVNVANGPMFGYSVEVAPSAILNDGLLDFVMFKKTHKIFYFLSLWRSLNKSIYKAKFVEHRRCREVRIKSKDSFFFHLDGEGNRTNQDLHFKIHPKTLNAWMPKSYPAEIIDPMS